jgi:iron complex outermembrane receptor protein
MSKIHFSQRYLKIFFAALVTGVCFFISGNAFAQQTISGTVRDVSNGNPLAGATIGIKGGTKKTVSDDKGAFTIAAPDNNSVIVISYVGYVTQEVSLGSRASLEIALIPSSGELNQVVVVGYGTQRKKDITGAVKSLKSEDFNKGIINSPQQLLQGKVAGVNVTSVSGEPGGILGITIRGPGGVRTSNTPLFVVDGIPLDNSATGRGDPLNFINPQDIESMDVLKDASATAIYGSRGANGVVIITTKKGKAGTSVLNFSTSVGFSTLANALPLFTADEFRVEVPKTGGVLDDKGASTDWQQIVTRTALTQNYNLTMSGGADKLSYYASFGMQKQEGIIKANELDRYNARFNATQRFLDDRLTIDITLGVTTTKNDRPPFTSVIGDAISNNPTYPVNDANGPFVLQGINNPLFYFLLDKEMSTINRVIGSISPSFKIVKGLVYKLNFGIDNSNGTNDIQSLPSTAPFREGKLETFYNYNRNKLIENYLTYSWIKTHHNLSALAGHSYQRIFVQGRNNSINRFPVSSVEPQYNPGLGQLLDLATNRPGGYAFVNELQSFFGRITYQYDSKYLATINFRADGSSKFGENNKYGYFPSFSLGWKISEEEFMKNITIVDNLKLRAGWGRTGNQEIPPKLTQALFTSSTSGTLSYPLYPTGPYPAGTIYSRLANPDLQWESSEQTDIGLDFTLLKGTLSGTIDLFRKVYNNILLQVPPADPIQPATTLWTNVKDMTITNKGVELEIEYRHNSTKGLGYNVGGTMVYMKNKVENSPYTVISSGSASGGAGLTSATINGYINGEPIGSFFLNQWTGIGANGLSTYYDKDKNGTTYTDNDRIVAGTALPNLIYSFFGGMAYKGFNLNFNFNGVSGNKIYDLTANTSFTKVRLSKNVNTTPEAAAEPNESVSNPAPVSTRYLKNGAYLRLNNMTLGYNFNAKSLGISKWITSLRLSVTGQNLFVITDYNGYDPEVNTDRNISDVTSYGIDYLSYPKAKSIIFGLNLSF